MRYLREGTKLKRIAIITSLVLIIGAISLPVAASAEVDMGWLSDFFAMFNQTMQNLAIFLSNAFSSLFSNIQSWLNPVLEWFGNKIQSIGQALGSAIDSLTNTLQNFWDAIKNFLSSIFKPVLDFIYGFLYLITQIFEIIKIIIILILNIFQVLIALATGLINTILGLTTWNESSEYFSVPNYYVQGFSYVINFLANSGLNLVAGIAAVGIWIITAHAAIRISSGGVRR